MAAQPKHTPGPWKLETESRSADGSDLLVTTPDGAWNVADCRDHSGLGVDNVEQAEANASLISAAPDLYAALRAALEEAEDCTREGGIQDRPHFDWKYAARSALARADGHA